MLVRTIQATSQFGDAINENVESKFLDDGVVGMQATMMAEPLAGTVRIWLQPCSAVQPMSPERIRGTQVTRIILRINAPEAKEGGEAEAERQVEHEKWFPENHINRLLKSATFQRPGPGREDDHWLSGLRC